MPNIVHFEICVDNLEAAAEFYSRVFGWHVDEIQDGSNYWPITTGDGEDAGISGGLRGRIDGPNPTINTIDVPSIDAFARKIKEAGGRVLVPKFAVAGVGYVQYCHDLEGNAFAILEYDEAATTL